MSDPRGSAVGNGIRMGVSSCTGCVTIFVIVFLVLVGIVELFSH